MEDFREPNNFISHTFAVTGITHIFIKELNGNLRGLLGYKLGWSPDQVL